MGLNQRELDGSLPGGGSTATGGRLQGCNRPDPGARRQKPPTNRPTCGASGEHWVASKTDPAFPFAVEEERSSTSANRA
jgi:hypothetical protein